MFALYGVFVYHTTIYNCNFVFFLGLLGKYVRFYIRSFCFRCQSEYWKTEHTKYTSCDVTILNPNAQLLTSNENDLSRMTSEPHMKPTSLCTTATKSWSTLCTVSLFCFLIQDLYRKYTKNEIYNGNVINILVLSF